MAILRETKQEPRVRAKRKMAGDNWDFDGETITVFISMTWKRRGGRKVIIAPDDGDAWAPAKSASKRDAYPRAGTGAAVEADAGGWDVSVSG